MIQQWRRGNHWAGSVQQRSKLDRALVSGIAWTALLRWSAQVLSWIATFFAARLLRPADYGIVAMANLGLGFVRMVEDFGLDSILLQDRAIDPEQQARLGGLIVAIGIVFCLAFAALARPLALFFQEPQVAWAVGALSLLFISDALQVVPRAALQRELQFRRFATLSLAQTIATQCVLLAGAAMGWGFWSLVVSSLAGGVAVTALLLAWRPYSIAWPYNLATLARPLLQGWRVIASRFAYYTFSSADQTIIGRVLGKDALGSYSFALTFANLPLQEVTAIVSRVVPGVFSEVQRQPVELTRYFLVLTEFLASVTLPMALGLALTADLVVRIALGPAWDAVIGPLRLLCVYAAFQGCQILVAHVLMWTGQFRAIMWCTVLAAVVLPIGFFLSAGHGLTGIGAVWAILYPVVNIPPLLLGLRTVSVSLRGWLGALTPGLISSAMMIVAVVGLRWILRDRPAMLSLAGAAFSGAIVYGATLWFGFRRRVLDAIEFVRAVRGKPAQDSLPVAV